MRVEFDENATRQLRAAIEWHLNYSERAALSFQSRVATIVEQLVEFPQSAPRVVDELRRARIPRSEYSLFYIVQDAVYVLAVLHGRQSPEEWDRLLAR